MSGFIHYAFGMKKITSMIARIVAALSPKASADKLKKPIGYVVLTDSARYMMLYSENKSTPYFGEDDGESGDGLISFA